MTCAVCPSLALFYSNLKSGADGWPLTYVTAMILTSVSSANITTVDASPCVCKTFSPPPPECDLPLRMGARPTAQRAPSVLVAVQNMATASTCSMHGNWTHNA